MCLLWLKKFLRLLDRFIECAHASIQLHLVNRSRDFSYLWSRLKPQFQ